MAGIRRRCHLVHALIDTTGEPDGPQRADHQRHGGRHRHQRSRPTPRHCTGTGAGWNGPGPAGCRPHRIGGRLWRPGHRLQDPGPELGPGWDRHSGGQPGGGGPHLPHLGAALLAPAEVALELGPLVLVERIERIGRRQRMHVRTHSTTPSSSRRRISPSRIRVFAVPSAMPSWAATSR